MDFRCTVSYHHHQQRVDCVDERYRLRRSCDEYAWSKKQFAQQGGLQVVVATAWVDIHRWVHPEAGSSKEEHAIREGIPLMGKQRESSQKEDTPSSLVEPVEQEVAALEVGNHLLEQCSQWGKRR